ncbi:acetylornithine deacetylase [Flavisphingomonas formosensis]|uniref:acetylornithine deacetylase n=1 Tax=Flavisphingomonas formosensis TaxID=861534 RepID=UPI001E2BB2DF|nr:acetylornithine deacetylase [Sphingomonas formosensis]
MTNDQSILPPDLDASLSWLERLVAFDTTSRNSNLALIDHVAAYLARLGIPSHRVANADGGKANLYFSVGPAVPGGIVLSGHTDVVPVDGQAWDSDPWSIIIRDDRIFGRGTADMKSFLALGIAAIPEMLAAGLRRPIHFALSYDEEVGLLGAPAMIAEISRVLPAPAAVVVGEPTEMRLVDRHKGILGLRTTVIGSEAHSSQTHLGVSANMVAARLMAKIDEMANRLASAPSDAGVGLRPAHTTLTIGVVHGGTAPNILAGRCEFIWDIRPTPGDDARALLDEFRTFADALQTQIRRDFPDCSITTEILSDAPPLRAEPQGEAATLVTRLTGSNARHAVSYVAEAGQFQQAGFSTVICGPGSIEQAHQPNEYISIAQFVAGRRFMRRLIEEFAR